MIMAEAISTPESRQRFLRTGVHGFHAATLVQKSAQSVQSVDQTPFVPPVPISEIRKLRSGRCLRGEDPYSRCYMPNANRWRSRMMAGGKKQYYRDMESALYLLGGGNNGRYYDAATGRFLSEDPTKEAGGDENLYRYASNDPVNNLDPSGHKKQPPPQHTFHPPQTQPAQNPNAHVNVKTPVAAHGTAGHTGSGQPPARGKSASGHADGAAGHDHAQRGQTSLNNRVANALQSKNPVLAFKKDPALAAEILRQLEKGMPPGGISYLELHANPEIMYALNQASRGRGLDLAHLKFFLGIIREEEHGQGGHAFNLMVTPQDIHQTLSWYANSQKGFAGAVNAVMEKPGVSDIAMGLIAIGGGAVGGLDDSGPSEGGGSGDASEAAGKSTEANSSKLRGDGGRPEGVKAAKNDIVIGKVKDIAPENLRDGEQPLLDRLPDRGNPQANWKQNTGVLRQEMRRGLPIRDATVDRAGNLTNNTGFLRAERALLQDRGWTYDPKTTMWNPPTA